MVLRATNRQFGYDSNFLSLQQKGHHTTEVSPYNRLLSHYSRRGLPIFVRRRCFSSRQIANCQTRRSSRSQAIDYRPDALGATRGWKLPLASLRFRESRTRNKTSSDMSTQARSARESRRLKAEPETHAKFPGTQKMVDSAHSHPKAKMDKTLQECAGGGWRPGGRK